MNLCISEIFYTITDLLLPDTCALCGTSLCLQGACDNSIPLCDNCFIQAENELCLNSSLIYSRCRLCGYPLSSEEGVCLSCREKTWNFTSASSLFLYTETGRNLICAYKFENRRGLGHYFAGLIKQYQRKNHPEAVIVPVPFRSASKRKRGWDQIEEITSVLKKDDEITICPCLKRDDGPAQKTMNYEKRLLNLNNKIHYINKYSPPEKVVLIDDVFTTGATMDYCARVLKNAGTKNIFCLSIALDL
jgi:ComF family protein